MPSLHLLDGVTWHGATIPGGRLATLLSVLASSPAGVSDQTLVDEIWGEEPPAGPTKALQVLVSRVRSICGAGVISRYDGGYRLTLADHDVDAWLLRRLSREAETALTAGDPTASDLADRAWALASSAADPERDAGPRADLLAQARAAIPRLIRLRGLALAAAGRPGEAVVPLVTAHEAAPDDTPVLVALLRAEAATAGASAALHRYEIFRSGLADRLGVDPDPALQRLHHELLSADDPVRTGLRYDSDALLGRADDLVRLRAAMSTGRLTTILGPGGIGKTRIAQVLAQESTVPRVHVVELVGVVSGDDVVAEVGAALGVRGSVTNRRTLTPAQQADVRGRIAQELDAGPVLLILDNCEHVLETVASLVAFLLVTARDLRVLTTSRAPLRIGAERVVPLTQLAPSDAAGLFCRRGLAVRPGADLDDESVAAVVARLDGLPLAIELAAARLRTMSVAEVRRRLDDRFELLRSRDRGAPERHRTLTAVIEWSWDLLSEREQRALARLSIFHDGFDLDAARSIVGVGAADDVEALVDQSLLVVAEAAGTTRFRALETIREFAALRLQDAGQVDDARGAQDDWAAALVDRHSSVFVTESQFESIDALLREENNLTDVLRRALGRGDSDLVARLVSVLGSVWTITGNHPRVFSVADAAVDALVDWDPPAHLVGAGLEAASMLIVHLSWLPSRPVDDLVAAMTRWGEPTTPWGRAAYAMFVSPGRDVVGRLLAQADDEADPTVAGMLYMWASLSAENAGDVHEAADYARRGLALGDLTPFLDASLHSELSQLAMVMGDHREAARHAEIAWPTLLRLHAVDDARSLRISTALSPLLEGDLDTCERILDEVEAIADGAQMGSRMVLKGARAEVALARGDVETGLRIFDEAVDAVSDFELPGVGLTPWVLLAAGGALVARVHHVSGPHDVRADELRDLLIGGTGFLDSGALTFTDLPLNGVLVVALGAWALRFGDPSSHGDGVLLLAVGERWAYNRSFPSLAWDRLVVLAERAAPGRIGELQKEYAGRPGADLISVTEKVLSRLTSSW